VRDRGCGAVCTKIHVNRGFHRPVFPLSLAGLGIPESAPTLTMAATPGQIR